MRFELTRVPTSRATVSGTTEQELEELIAGLEADEDFQLWMSKDSGDSACVLANGRYAHLSILPQEGDYLTSCSEESPASATTTDIYLENGQLDKMAIEQCVPRATGIRAGLHYFRTGANALFVRWLVV